jgi:hypothetical protein
MLISLGLYAEVFKREVKEKELGIKFIVHKT